MIVYFVRFTSDRCCPVCCCIHQMDVMPIVVECQPNLYGWAGSCSGRVVLLSLDEWQDTGKTGHLMDWLNGRFSQLASQMMADREDRIWRMIAGEK